jgi:hypothetical protein
MNKEIKQMMSVGVLVVLNGAAWAQLQLHDLGFVTMLVGALVIIASPFVTDLK